MAYTPKFQETDFTDGLNILASEHFQFIEAGATLDGVAIGDKVLPIGSLIARNDATGKFEEFSVVEGFSNFAITNYSIEMDGENDAILGEAIVRGSVYEAKLAGAVPAEFKAANPLIRYVSHV